METVVIVIACALVLCLIGSIASVVWIALSIKATIALGRAIHQRFQTPLAACGEVLKAAVGAIQVSEGRVRHIVADGRSAKQAVSYTAREIAIAVIELGRTMGMAKEQASSIVESGGGEEAMLFLRDAVLLFWRMRGR